MFLQFPQHACARSALTIPAKCFHGFPFSYSRWQPEQTSEAKHCFERLSAQVWSLLVFSFECAFLLLSSSSLHLPSVWDLILDLITPSFLLPQGDCIHAVCLISPLSDCASVCACVFVRGGGGPVNKPALALQPVPVTTGISLETAGLHWCRPVCIQKKIMRLLGHLFVHNNDAQ